MQNKKVELVFVTILGLMLMIIGIFKINENNKDLNNKEEDNEEQFSYTPLMYQICDDDSCIYLLGSIHLGDNRVSKFNDVIIDAYNKSDILAVELDTNEINIDIEEFILEDGKTLDDFISEELNEKLETFASVHPLFAYDVLKEYKLGYLYDYISLLAYMEQGYLNEGVDSYFLALAHSDNKEIISLETYEKQINLLLGYSDEFYINEIEYTIDNYDFFKDLALELYDAYLTGDEEKINNILNEEADVDIEETEEMIKYNKETLDDRNVYMASKVEEFLADNKRVFMTVGCAHVIGDNGIIDLLSDKYKISIVK